MQITTKLRFISDIFKSSNKSIAYNYFSYLEKCLKTFQLNIIKKIKKVYKEEKEEKEKKIEKSDNSVVNVTKISPKIKINKLFGYRKKYYKMRKKRFIIIIRKNFDLKNFASL